MPVFENERGTFIFNSKDLLMIDHIPELVESGISSFKIEGRVKTSYYLATVVKAYREEIDRYFADPKGYVFDETQLIELKKVSHRPYYTGFYFGKPDEAAQVYTDSSYIREYDLIGIVIDYDKETKMVTVSQRNRFFEGDEVETLEPGKPFKTLKVEDMYDEKGEKISVAPHAKMIVKFKSDEEILLGAMIRKQR